MHINVVKTHSEVWARLFSQMPFQTTANMKSGQRHKIQSTDKWAVFFSRYAGWARSLIRPVTQYFTITTTTTVEILHIQFLFKRAATSIVAFSTVALCNEHADAFLQLRLLLAPCGSSCRSPVFCVILAEDTLSSGQCSFVKNTEADEGKADSRWRMSMLSFIGRGQLAHIETLRGN